jgi:hypothetical protein
LAGPGSLLALYVSSSCLWSLLAAAAAVSCVVSSTNMWTALSDFVSVSSYYFLCL